MNRINGIYVSAALRHASAGHLEDTRIIKDLLRQSGREVIDFVLGDGAKFGDVYKGEGVPRGSLTLAILGDASDGRGFEIAMSIFRFLRPVLAVVSEERREEVSRLITDISIEIPDALFRFRTYKVPSEVVDSILPEFEKIVPIKSPVDIWHQHAIGAVPSSPFTDALRA
jgi:hypothetical protein